uniref:Death domain-containing protein n=1 Tax=Amphimedon queenslandica TaxID=400682 RepID=A0A1X7T679_AMPQE
MILDQLINVLNLLKRCGFPQRRWKELGLTLGLHKNTLDAMEVTLHGDVFRCLLECLSQWLSRADNVDSKGGATINSLSDALKSMNETAAADKLDQESSSQKMPKSPPPVAPKPRSLSQSGRSQPLSTASKPRPLSQTAQPPPTASKPRRPSLTTQPPPKAPKPRRSQDSSSAPHDPTAAVLQDKEGKKDPSSLEPMEGSMSPEYITMKEMLADLVDLLAENAPVISQINNHLFSSDLIPKAVHVTVESTAGLTPYDRTNKIFSSVLATLECHPNPNSVFSSLVTSLQKVGLKNMASKLMEKLKMKGGHVDANLEQQPSVSEGPLQPVGVTAQSHTPQPTITGSQSSTPTTVIELSSKDEVAANIGGLNSRFASLDSNIRDEFEELVEKGKVKLKAEVQVIESNREETGEVKWGSDSVSLTKPSAGQCQEVISQLTDSHRTIFLRHLSPDIVYLMMSQVLDIRTIKGIGIFNTKITIDVILLLSHKITNNASLEILSISADSISDDGVIALTQSLINNKTITRLLLHNNPDITSSSAQSLAELLLYNHTLSYLYLFGTNIDTDGVLVLMESLRTNNTLWRLCLDYKHKQTCYSLPYYKTIENRLYFW